jgi:hypothetical protein
MGSVIYYPLNDTELKKDVFVLHVMIYTCSMLNELYAPGRAIVAEGGADSTMASRALAT